MNILHVKYAYEVAKAGSMKKASEKLFVAMPNISRSIKELEADLGITIFDRTVKGMRLTPDGEEFMNYAKGKLGLKNLTVVGKRFETSGLAYLDFVSCRALSTFENDWERAQPALKKGGLFLTLKSFNSISHLENDPAVNIWKYKLPNEEQDYALVTRGNK